MVDTRREVFFIMSNEDERLVAPFAKGFNDGFYPLTVVFVQTM